MSQQWLFGGEEALARVRPFKPQLLKWIGNKQRFAHEIAAYFPAKFDAYYEPFLGSGAVLGALAPQRAFASDAFPPLMEIWLALNRSPETLKALYAERWQLMGRLGKVAAYAALVAIPNTTPKQDMITDSFRIMVRIKPREAPSDLRIPISRVRSRMVMRARNASRTSELHLFAGAHPANFSVSSLPPSG